MTNFWTEQEMWFVETLALRVPLLASWMLDPLRISGRQLHRLLCAGLVDLYQLPVVTPVGVSRPVFSWQPGERLPSDGRAVSDGLRNRWSDRVPDITEVYCCSPLAASLFGSTSGQLSAPQHWNHDLLLGETFAWYVTHATDEAARFVGEHSLPKAGYGISDPDAFVCDNSGQVIKVVESGGSYGVQAVEKVIHYAAQRSLALEIW